MKQIFATVSVVIGTLSCTASMLGCGASDGKESVSKYPVGQRGSIQACLERRGAVPAFGSSDLAFLAAAEANDSVSKPAFVYDKVAKLVVDIWEGLATDAGYPEWTLWYAHLFGESIDPRDIVEDHPAKSYVFYINKPSLSESRRVRSCVGFDRSKRKTTVINRT
jgi:hypothetical protein